MRPNNVLNRYFSLMLQQRAKYMRNNHMRNVVARRRKCTAQPPFDAGEGESTPRLRRIGEGTQKKLPSETRSPDQAVVVTKICVDYNNSRPRFARFCVGVLTLFPAPRRRLDRARAPPENCCAPTTSRRRRKARGATSGVYKHMWICGEKKTLAHTSDKNKYARGTHPLRPRPSPMHWCLGANGSSRTWSARAENQGQTPSIRGFSSTPRADNR